MTIKARDIKAGDILVASKVRVESVLVSDESVMIDYELDDKGETRRLPDDFAADDQILNIYPHKCPTCGHVIFSDGDSE